MTTPVAPQPKAGAHAPASLRRRTPVAHLAAGESVDSIYLLSALEQRSKKNGDPFFSLTLVDATGSVGAVMWDHHDALIAGTVAADDFVRVDATVAEYNGGLQLTLRRIERVEESTVEVADFLAVSPRPRPEMEAELDALIDSVKNADCRRLLSKLFSNGRFRDLYCTAPAAAKIHQAYIGGLLEHTLNVVRNALLLANNYRPFDRDLLVTAGILHDVGKIREYSWRRTIVYTDEGRLLGHISIGAAMVDGVIRNLMRDPEGFSEFYHRHILHLILSHHGKLEYGSPTVPKTREALLLHYGDYTDAYLSSYVEAINAAQAKGQGWTGYNKMFEAYLYAGTTPAAEAVAAPGAGLPAASPATMLPAAGEGRDVDPRARAYADEIVSDG